MVESAARVTVLLGSAWLVGLLPVTRYVLAATPAARPGTAWAQGRALLAVRVTRSLDIGLLAVLAGTAVLVASNAQDLLAAGLAADRAGALTALLGTRFGQLTVLRALVAVALWLAVRPAMPGRALPGQPRAPGDRTLEIAWGLLALPLVLSFPLAGHAAAGSNPELLVPVDAAHLAAAAVWLTGIGALGLLLPDVLARQRERVRLSLLAPALGRFARLAAVAVGVIVVTGTLNAVVAVGGVDQLRTTPYGQALVVKLWLVVWVLGLGALNHVVLVPRLVRVSAARRPARSTPEATLALTVGAEVLLGALIVVATAVLVGLPPPR